MQALGEGGERLAECMRAKRCEDTARGGSSVIAFRPVARGEREVTWRDALVFVAVVALVAVACLCLWRQPARKRFSSARSWSHSSAFAV